MTEKTRPVRTRRQAQSFAQWAAKGVLALATLHGAHSQPNADAQTRYRLPAAPQTAVISYDTAFHIDGQLLPKSGPDLVIFSDGTIVVHDPFGLPPVTPAVAIDKPNRRPPHKDDAAAARARDEPVAPATAHVSHITDKLSPKQLQELLAFIIEQNDYFEYNSERVHRRAAPDKLVADAATTTFTVTADGKTHRVWAYALHTGIGRKSMVAEFVQIQAVHDRLRAMRMDVIAHAKRTGKPPPRE